MLNQNERLPEWINMRAMQRMTRYDVHILRQEGLERNSFWRLYTGLAKTTEPTFVDGPYSATTLWMFPASTEYMIKSLRRDT